MKKWSIIITTLCIWLISLGPINPYSRAKSNKTSPQLILVLGGNIDREIIGINLSKVLNIPVIISGGSNPEYAQWLIKKQGIDHNQVSLDYRAQDTLSNFTSIMDDLIYAEVNHMLMITSENHFNRANLVGKIITGSKGIKLSSLAVKCNSTCQVEPKIKEILDSIRAIVWVCIKNDPRLIYEKIFN